MKCFLWVFLRDVWRPLSQVGHVRGVSLMNSSSITFAEVEKIVLLYRQKGKWGKFLSEGWVF